MKLNKVLLGVVGSALVLGTVAVVGTKGASKVSASEVVADSNVAKDEETNETFMYRINYERIIQSGQSSIRGDRTLVYSINGGEEKEEKMHKDMCEGDLYKWFCDVEVQEGDVITYKVVTTYDDGKNTFLMQEGNGTVTAKKTPLKKLLFFEKLP